MIFPCMTKLKSYKKGSVIKKKVLLLDRTHKSFHFDGKFYILPSKLVYFINRPIAR